MHPSLHLQPRHFPARVADLGFTAQLPADWISHDLPAETVDVSDPTAFFPLAVVTAPHAALVFAFAARPAYDDGTLHDWTWFHLNHQGLKPRAVGAAQVAGLPAVMGEATQESELGTMVVRFAFLEDGGRLINLLFTAPELLEETVRPAWFAMLASFTLETPRGSRFTVEAGAQAIPAPAPVVETRPEPAPERTQAEAFAAMNSFGMRVPEGVSRRKASFFDFALASDAASLDPETPINVNLRERGIGLVPAIAATHDEARRATLHSGAIEAQLDVPYGWHVIDDGRRTLVFEPSGKVQVNLDLIPREGRSNVAILDAIEAQARADYPAPECTRVKLGAIKTLAVRHIADGDQPIEQFHLLVPFRDDTCVLRARVTATPEEATDACNLAGLILDSCVFDCFQQRDGEDEPEETSAPMTKRERKAARKKKVENDQPPVWWDEALALEARGELEAAENRIREGCPYIWSACATAKMYRLRMNRLKAAGDEAGALEAFKKSSDFIFYYASLATSGGEGAALSLERDAFRAELVAEYGSDPELAAR